MYNKETFIENKKRSQEQKAQRSPPLQFSSQPFIPQQSKPFYPQWCEAQTAY